MLLYLGYYLRIWRSIWSVWKRPACQDYAPRVLISRLVIYLAASVEWIGTVKAHSPKWPMGLIEDVLFSRWRVISSSVVIFLSHFAGEDEFVLTREVLKGCSSVTLPWATGCLMTQMLIEKRERQHNGRESIKTTIIAQVAVSHTCKSQADLNRRVSSYCGESKASQVVKFWSTVSVCLLLINCTDICGNFPSVTAINDTILEFTFYLFLHYDSYRVFWPLQRPNRLLACLKNKM